MYISLFFSLGQNPSTQPQIIPHLKSTFAKAPCLSIRTLLHPRQETETQQHTKPQGRPRYRNVPPSSVRSLRARLPPPSALHSTHFGQEARPTQKKHYSDLVMCRKQPGIAIGRLCDKCDGKCPVCDSYVRPTTLVRICDECSFGNYQNKCVVCGGEVCEFSHYPSPFTFSVLRIRSLAGWKKAGGGGSFFLG